MAKRKQNPSDLFANLLIVSLITIFSSFMLFGLFLSLSGLYAKFTNSGPPLGFIMLSPIIMPIFSIVIFPFIWLIYTKK